MKKYIVLSILSLSLVNPSKARADSSMNMFVIGNALDLTTTIVALKRPMLKEGNPILSNNGMIGLKLGVSALIGLSLHKMSKTKPRTARIIGYTFGILYTGIAMSNARLIVKY